ncbi:butyrate induced transcript [Aphelenchoides avenae]|nr:butyrate induced transcript [Aphelenchus avenae]
MSRSPSTYWAQDKDAVFLRVDVRDAKDVNVSVRDGKLHFSGDGVASEGEKQHYEFTLGLQAHVNEEVNVKKADTKVEIVLTKTESGFWPTLTGGSTKYPWLKFDFERWKDPDSSEASDDDFEKLALTDEERERRHNEKMTDEILKNFKGKTFSPEEAMQRINMIYSSYLGFYNVGMFLAHFYVLCCLVFGYVMYGAVYLEGFWRNKRDAFIVCTILQFFDVMHAAMGLTKSGYKTALLQVIGRLAVLYIIDGNPQIHTAASTFCLLMAYFLIEMFRYPYYALNSLSTDVKVVTWLRYNMWIPLYPIGLLLELITFVRSIPYYYASGKYGIELPNSANFAFNFGIFLAIFTLTLFPLIAYQLLGHMYSQRKKKMLDSKKKKM